MSIGISTAFPTAAEFLAVELPEPDGIYGPDGAVGIFMNLSGSDRRSSLYPVVAAGLASLETDMRLQKSQPIVPDSNVE